MAISVFEKKGELQRVPGAQSVGGAGLGLCPFRGQCPFFYVVSLLEVLCSVFLPLRLQGRLSRALREHQTR